MIIFQPIEKFRSFNRLFVRKRGTFGRTRKVQICNFRRLRIVFNRLNRIFKTINVLFLNRNCIFDPKTKFLRSISTHFYVCSKLKYFSTLFINLQLFAKHIFRSILQMTKMREWHFSQTRQNEHNFARNFSLQLVSSRTIIVFSKSVIFSILLFSKPKKAERLFGYNDAVQTSRGARNYQIGSQNGKELCQAGK